MLELALPLSWKLLATAVMIVAAARIAERSGPIMASILMTFPMNAGPGFFFIALDHESHFITEGALLAFAAAGPVLLFMGIYARLAPRFSFAICLLAASIIWWVPMLTLLQLEVNFPLAAGFVMVGIALSRLLRRNQVWSLSGPLTRISWPVLLVRACVAGLVVASVASAAPFLGPQWSGLLLGYPTIIATSVWVMHRRYGGDFTAATLLAGQRAMLTYGSFCLSLYLLAQQLPGVIAVLTALLLAFSVAALQVLLSRASRPNNQTKPQ